MKQINHVLLKMLVASVACFLSSCSGNESANNAASAYDTVQTIRPKMSAKKRLVKNNILERHTNRISLYLTGNVKKRTQTTYKLLENLETPEESSADSFDIRGNRIMMVSYINTDGKLEKTHDSIVFDANDNEIARYRRKKGKYKIQVMSAYDVRGNEIAITIYNEDETIYCIDSYKYDDKDNLIQLALMSNKCTYKYDENGFVAKGEVFDTTGKLISRQTRKYNDKGSCLYSRLFNADGSIDQSDSCKYNDKEQLEVRASYNADGSLRQKYVMKYDDKGNKTEIVKYKLDGSIDERSIAFYDYEYDNIGNIIKKVKFEMKGGKKVTTEISKFAYSYY